jgi:hypothetical protein
MDDEHAEREIIGRVYKKRQTHDYDSIPVELKINPALWDSMTPLAKPEAQNDRRRSAMVEETPKISLDKRRNSDGILATNAMTLRQEETRQLSSPFEAKPPHSAVLAGPTIYKPLPKQRRSVEQAAAPSPKVAEVHQESVPKSPVRRVSIRDIADRVENMSSQPSYQAKSKAVKSSPLGIPTAVEPITSRRRSSGALDQNLDVIVEDETVDSVATDSILKSSLASQYSSKAQGFNSEPIGEHAKSMARELGLLDRSKRRMCECDLTFRIRLRQNTSCFIDS